MNDKRAQFNIMNDKSPSHYMRKAEETALLKKT